jgi:pimeloyl-ACP methyl ester carboxylesterase
MASDASILALSDGRVLSYASYGSTTPTSPIIFYFHSFPASRIEGVLWAPLALSLGARLIAASRPGFGSSTFKPDRRILDWPSDVLELADHLQVSQFYILGVSGGCPYVLACLKEIPRSRLLGAAVVAGLYPLKLGVSGMIAASRVMLFLAAWATPLVAPLIDWQLGQAARDSDPTVLEKLFMKEMSGRPEVDRKCLENLGLKQQLLDSLRESVKFGSQGMAWEARLFGSDWGFELKEVEFEGLCLWHGKADVNCPSSMAEKAVTQIKGAELRLFEGEAHLSLPINHAEEVLRHLLQVHS